MTSNYGLIPAHFKTILNFREIEKYHTKTYKHEIKHEYAEIWPILLHNNYIKM